MEEPDKLNEELFKQVDQALKALPLDAAPPLLNSKVMEAINSKPAVVYINSWIIKMISAFFAGCILLCLYYSDLDFGSLKFPDHKSIVDSIPPNLLILLVFANIIAGLFLMDRLLRQRFNSEFQ